ncbi:peptidylprolyl isomerase, partial [Candidatus Endoriftia persephone str. Guaymas]|nr:peptidylprolyl isomerase [Candidatus Endoriftia persephone str. Guaymas]
PRSHVNVSGDLEVGLKLRGRNGSNVTPITVVEFDDETVTLDANNPLAGATLGVELVIVEVRDAIDEELKSGRVQDMEAIYEKERVDGVVVEFKL